MFDCLVLSSAGLDTECNPQLCAVPDLLKAQVRGLSCSAVDEYVWANYCELLHSFSHQLKSTREGDVVSRSFGTAFKASSRQFARYGEARASSCHRTRRQEVSFVRLTDCSAPPSPRRCSLDTQI